MSFVAPELIESKRLHLRTISESDLPALLIVNSDAETTRFVSYKTWTSMADAQAWYQQKAAQQAAGSALQFVVVEKQSQTVVGNCVLFRFDEGSARAELGYVLGRDYWGCGYMKEAATALIACAFSKLALRRIEAEVDPRNVASSRLIQQLGFTKEGLLRQRWITKGEAVDVETYGLLNHEWPL